jgi:hypothetical protein
MLATLQQRFSILLFASFLRKTITMSEQWTRTAEKYAADEQNILLFF